MKKPLEYHIFIPVGSAYEPSSIKGISHFLEHLVFAYESRSDFSEFTKFLNDNNIKNYAETSEFYTHVYFLDLDKELLPLLKKKIKKIINNPNLSKDLFSKQKRVIKEEVAYLNQQIDSIVDNHFLKLVFKGTPLEKPIEGTVASIEKINLDEINKWHTSHYSNLVEIIFNKLTGETKVNPKHSINTPKIKPKKECDGKRIKGKFNLKSSGIEIGWFYETNSQKERVALDLISRILGGMNKSFIYTRLISKLNLIYKGNSHIQHFKEGVLLSAYLFSTKPNQVLKEFDRYFNEVLNKGIDKDSFNLARRLEKNYFDLPDDNLPDIIGDEFLSTGKLWMPNKRILLIEKIKKEEVEEVAKKLFQKKPFTLVVN